MTPNPPNAEELEAEIAMIIHDEAINQRLGDTPQGLQLERRTAKEILKMLEQEMGWKATPCNALLDPLQ